MDSEDPGFTVVDTGLFKDEEDAILGEELGLIEEYLPEFILGLLREHEESSEE